MRKSRQTERDNHDCDVDPTASSILVMREHTKASLRLELGDNRLVVLVPVIANLVTAAHPHLVVRLYIVQELGKAEGAAGAANDATVQANRHHLGCGRALGVEDVKCILRVWFRV